MSKAIEEQMSDEHHGGGILNRLPFDLCIQILSLLPVKSLLVLRVVCKWLNAVIGSSDFISFHLRHSPGTEILIVAPIEPPPGIMMWKVQSSVDGLVLLVSSLADRNGSESSILWNPSLRKYRHVRPTMRDYKHFALGYLASCNDYKVLVTNWKQAWVYSVKWAAYCRVSNTNNGMRQKLPSRVVCSQSLCFKDGVVWTETDESSNSLELVWFDFGTKRFRYTEEMPYDSKNSRSRLMMLDGGSTIGMWRVDVEDQATASIWALETDAMSWARRYKIPQEMVPFGMGVEMVKLVERNGELVCTYWTKEGPSVQVLWYHIQTKAIKGHQKNSGFKQDTSCVGVFIESLVTP